MCSCDYDVEQLLLVANVLIKVYVFVYICVRRPSVFFMLTLLFLVLLYLWSIAFSLVERFQDVVVRSQPDWAVEGAESFALLYSMREGVVEQQAWFFNGKAINTDSHYLVRHQSLVIVQPHRNDTGLYTLALSNPFSNTMTNMTVIVRCKN